MAHHFIVGVLRDNYPFGQWVKIVRVDGRTRETHWGETYAEGYVEEIAAASFGDRAILVWSQYEDYGSDFPYVEAIILDPNQNTSGRFRVTDGVGSWPNVVVDSQSAQALIVWHDEPQSNESDIKGRFVNPNGLFAGDEFTISDEPREQMFPAVAWIGDQFVVAWNDYRHIAPGEQDRADIYAARLRADGTVLDPGGNAVTESPLPEDLPAVAGLGDDSVIMFSMLYGPEGVPEIQRLAYRVLGDPGQLAPLTDFAITFGTLISGTLQDLVDSDDSHVRARSRLGFVATRTQQIDLRVGAETTLLNGSSLDISVEGRISQPGGVGTFRLRNWNTNSFEQVHTYPIGSTEIVETINDVPAVNRIRQSHGRIELIVRQQAIATFAASFDSFTDHVVIAVR